MYRHLTKALIAAIVVLAQPVWAQSPTYHLERLEIQARSFLGTLEPTPPAAGAQISETVDQQLAGNSAWARQMVSADVVKIVETSRDLTNQLVEGADADELQAAKTNLEGLARRLRVSSSALVLNDASRTSLDFLMLELEESASVMDIQRQQLLAQEKQQRSRRSWVGSVGFGYGAGYGSPFGWGGYLPYGNINGPGYYGGGFYGGGFGGGFGGGYGGGRVYGVGPRGGICR